jgi:hypothetical protein
MYLICNLRKYKMYVLEFKTSALKKMVQILTS